MTGSQMSTTMATIQAWVEETQQVISSQASFDTFQPAEVEEILARFQAVLHSNLTSQHVSQMVRAITLLMNVTGNLVNKRDQLVDLLHGVLTSFLSLTEHGQITKELNEEVLEVVVEQSGEVKEVKMLVLVGLAGQMLAVISNSNMVDWMRRSWLKTFNMLLSGSNYNLREDIAREYAEDIEQLVDYLYTCGDYDTQSSLVETLLRFTSKADRSNLAMTWFPNYALVQSLFVRIKDFETDCRNFLNCFNQGLGDNQLVFSLPTLTCQVGEQQMFKPPDQTYRQFWVDFNLGPGSISIYHVKEEMSSDLWDLVTITQEMVTSAVTSCQAGTTVLTLSFCQSPLPASQAVLVFTPDPKLSQLIPNLGTSAQQLPVQAVTARKCSRSAGQLLLPKSTCVPQAVPAVQLIMEDISSSSQASLPCGQAGVRMSTAEVDNKDRQAAHYTAKVEDKAENVRCSQSHQVRLAVRRKEGMDEEHNNNNLPENLSKGKLKEWEQGEAMKKTDEEARIKADERVKENARAKKEARVKAEEDAKKEARAEKKVKEEAKATQKAKEEARIQAAEKVVEAARIKTEKAVNEEAEKKAVEDARIKAAERNMNNIRVKEEAKEEARVKKEKQANAKAAKKSSKKAKFEAEKKAAEKAMENARDKAEELAKEEARVKAEKKAVEEAIIKANERLKENARAEEEARAKAEKKAKEKAIVSRENEAKAAEKVKNKAAEKKAEEDARFKTAEIVEDETRFMETTEIRSDAKDCEQIEEKENVKEIEAAAKVEGEAVGETKVVEAAIDNGEVVVDVDKFTETPKRAILGEMIPLHVCVESDSDYLPPSPATSFTLSGGRRRNKRKLSLTKRNDPSQSKAKCVKLSFSPLNTSLPIISPTTVTSSLLAEDSCPPSSCDSIKGLGHLLAGKPKLLLPKKPGMGRVSTSPGLSQVGEVSQEDAEMEELNPKENNKMKKRDKTYQRSSMKKNLLYSKSLLVEGEVSEISTSESVNNFLSFTPEAPSYEEVYKRKNTSKHLKHQVSYKKGKVPVKPTVISTDQSDILPPLIVSRKSLITTDLVSSLLSTSTASSNKFFKTKFRQNLGSNISLWSDSLLGGGKKTAAVDRRRRSYSKTGLGRGITGNHSLTAQSDPYNMVDISPQVAKLNMKDKKSKPRRKTFSSSLALSKSDRSTRLFSDESDDDMETTKVGMSPIPNPAVSSIYNKPSSLNFQQKEIVNKRKPSLCPTTICAEQETSCLPPLLDQSTPSHSLHRQSNQGSAGDGGDQDLGEVETVLILTVRVLEMVARNGKREPQHREMWGNIRRSAERELGRK